jgi:hypothetical protein
VQASEIAETGLNRKAVQVMEYFKSHGSLSGILNNIEQATSSGGQYAVSVADNCDVGGTDQDGDGSCSTDTDRIVLLTSIGKIGPGEQTVEAYLKVEASSVTPPSSGGIGAVGLCAAHTNISRASNITGVDYAPPPDGCSGASCRSTPSGLPSNTGVSYNSGSSIATTGGSPGGSPSTNPNAGIDCAAWETFTDAAVTAATGTFNAASGPFNGSDSAIRSAFGTAASPKVVVIQGTAGSTAQFNGNLQGSGILIVRNVNAVFNGTFAFTGLVIIENDSGSISISGNSQLFGSVMVLRTSVTDSQVELNIGSTQASIKWSSEGVGRASTALSATGGGNPTVRVLAWRQTRL